VIICFLQMNLQEVGFFGNIRAIRLLAFAIEDKDLGRHSAFGHEVIRVHVLLSGRSGSC